MTTTRGRKAGRSSGASSGHAGREAAVRVRTAKGRKTSSTLWLQRQLNDPYVADAKRRGLRSRAAFKIAEIDEAHGLFRPGGRVLDLGATPGGWTQLAVERTAPGGRVVAVDLVEMDPVAGAEFLKLDFLAADAVAMLEKALGGPVDVILSDMAAPSTGHRKTDQLRAAALAEAVVDFARSMLSPGGALVLKAFQGGIDAALLAALKRDFETVRHVKPPASRQDSREVYLVATGFRGAGAADAGAS